MKKKNICNNVLLPADVVERAEALAKGMNMTLTQLVSNALDEFMKKAEEEKNEKERIENEAIEACKFYYDLDKHIADEWRSAESRI